jgi:hypothetical protein
LRIEPCLFLLLDEKWILVIRSWVAYDIWFLYRAGVCACERGVDG